MTRTMLRFVVALSACLPSVFPGTQACAAGAGSEKFDPPALYLTWQGDPTTTMTIRWHSNKENKRDDVVEYQQRGASEWRSAKGCHHDMSHSERIVHVVELTGLDPGAVYRFRLGEDSAVYQFRTMPSDLTSEEVRFVVGGDTYGKPRWWYPKDWFRRGRHYYELLRKTNLKASKTSPMFVVIGGDFTYSNGEEGQAERWYKWLTAWKEDMVTSDSLLIPLMPVIGNHEVVKGYKKDWYKPNKPSSPATQAPYFYSLFIAPDSSSYRVLDFGNYMSLILLDSGHTTFVDEQEQWLADTLEARLEVPYKFAAYHVPAYPSACDSSDEIPTRIRKWWVPLFEQFELDVAFEHHDHTYKRTHNLNGVVYLGGGAWGKERKPKPNRWYLATAQKEYHFILVKLQEQTALFQAIDSNGQVFDEYSKPAPRSAPFPRPQFCLQQLHRFER